LAGCSSSAAASTAASSASASSSDKVIKVGATSVPHAQILNEVVKGVLAMKDGLWK
jgi:D-methionine transport system substrate-binding protein